jgi:hypothetical protein
VSVNAIIDGSLGEFFERGIRERRICDYCFAFFEVLVIRLFQHVEVRLLTSAQAFFCGLLGADSGGVQAEGFRVR